MIRSRLALGLMLSVLSGGEPHSGGTSAAGLQSPAEVPDTWEFAVGGPDERLEVDPAQMPGIRQPVTLPHRVPRPNTALWYARDLSIPPHTAIEIDADDGAQSVDTRAVYVVITGGAGGSLEAPQPDALGTAGDRLAVRHHFLYATANERELTFDAVDVKGESFDRVAIGRVSAAKDVPRP